MAQDEDVVGVLAAVEAGGEGKIEDEEEIRAWAGGEEYWGWKSVSSGWEEGILGYGGWHEYV